MQDPMLDLFVDIGLRRIWSKSRMGLGFICDVLHDNHGLHAAGGCTCAQAKEGRGSGEGWASRDQYSWLENPRRIIEAHSPSQISTHPWFKPVTFLLWHCLKFLAKIYPFSQKEYAKHLPFLGSVLSQVCLQATVLMILYKSFAS